MSIVVFNQLTAFEEVQIPESYLKIYSENCVQAQS